jgi:hypothetical protein
MKLIKEDISNTKLIVEEKLGKGKTYFIEGIFLQSAIKNRNGRMYPESVMDKEVGRYMQEQVLNNRAYGELGHPDNPSINLDRVSHMIVDLRKEGTNYIGRAKILETPMGMIARGLLGVKQSTWNSKRVRWYPSCARRFYAVNSSRHRC